MDLTKTKICKALLKGFLISALWFTLSMNALASDLFSKGFSWSDYQSSMDSGLPMKVIDIQLPEELADVSFSAESANRSEVAQQTQYIIGGNNASRNEYGEYVLVLVTDGVSEILGFCGGTLIATNKVLTAGHCADAFAFQYLVIPNFYSFNDPVTASDLVEVNRVASHPNYTSGPDLNYDLAVLTLANNVFTPQAKVHTGTNKFVGDIGDVIGVGLTSTNPFADRPILQEVNAPIVDNEACNQRWQAFDGSQPATPQVMCAGYTSDGRGSCFGDSGGPLWNNVGGQRVLVGTVSFGFPTCEFNRATQGYARLSAMTDFIKSESPATQFVFSSETHPIGAIMLLLEEDELPPPPP